MKILASLLIAAALTGCDQTSEAKRAAYHEPHVVILWSGGKAVREWRSKERPHRHNEGGSVLAFVDSETDTYVMLRGTISVERTE